MNFWKKQEKKVVIHNEKMNLFESIERHALENPDKIAFSFDNKIELNYSKLIKEVNKFANYFKKIGLKKGSRVFLFLPKCPEMYISFIAVIKAGMIACPLFEAFQTDGLELRLNRGDANLLITNKELSKRLKKSPKGMKKIIVDDKKIISEIKKQSFEFDAVIVDKWTTATMIFTSSTAGTPVAGIQIPHYALVQQHYTAELVLKLTKDTNYFCTAHPAWVTGSVYGIIAPLSIGCTNFILSGRFDAKNWLNFIKKNKISVLYTAPTALRMLKPFVKKTDLKNLKILASVGEALEKSTFEFYKELGIEITDTYWQTETGAIVIAGYNKKIPGSIGKAVPGIKAKIKDKKIILKTPWPAMMTGIYKHPKMYASYFEGKWFKTNDSARKDFTGNFHFIGRADDIIKTSGERVSPIEIESILMKHPAVKEVAVIGIPDKIKGSIIKAFVVLNKKEDDKLKEELSNFVKENYAGHSYPKEIEFLDSLPKTNSGKIIRMKLRE